MYPMSDMYELALVLCGLDPDSDEDFEKEDEVDGILYDKYGITDTDGFELLIKDLTAMIAVDKSPLTGKIYRGFGKGNSWLYKVEV